MTGGYWQAEDGSAIVDKGCRESAKIFNTPAEKAFAAQQWNEVAHIPHIEHPTLDQIKGIIKDGKICAAGDPKKASLDQPTPYWTKTDVTPGQSLTMRLIGTAPHVPSTFYAFMTRPGFNSATDMLKWNDLEQLGQSERFTVASTDPKPPALIPAQGFFLITRSIPSSASGDGLIVGIWVRDDPNGEFFISCSDVRFQRGGVPDPLNNIGPFIGGDMLAVKPGESVHFRIFGDDGAQKELVDITQKISTANLAPGKWGKEIADQVNASIARIGELEGQTVKFNQETPLINSTYATNKSYTQAMSIIPDGGPGPVNPAPPVARITGPTSLKSGQAFTFSGTGSTGSNGTLLYQWAIAGLEGSPNANTASGKAYNVTESTPFKVRLNVLDQQNKKVSQAEFNFTVTPASGGEEYDQYVPNTAYKAGDKVSHNGGNYECKPWPYTGWCSLPAYEPGKPDGTWTNAWEKL